MQVIAACFVTTARFVTKVTKRAAMPARFVSNEVSHLFFPLLDISACRITCERNESARERRIALYKSNHHHHRYHHHHHHHHHHQWCKSPMMEGQPCKSQMMEGQPSHPTPTDSDRGEWEEGCVTTGKTTLMKARCYLCNRRFTGVWELVLIRGVGYRSLSILLSDIRLTQWTSSGSVACYYKLK